MRTQVSFMRQSVSAGGGMAAQPDGADNTVAGTDVTLLTDEQRGALVCKQYYVITLQDRGESVNVKCTSKNGCRLQP
jgi:hypothetical protein